MEPVLAAAYSLRSDRCDVLHVPCGDGIISARMVKMGWNLTCADPIEMNLIRTSQALAEADVHAVLLKASLPCLPVANGTFDICIALTALLSPAFLNESIAELTRIVKDDGLLILGAEGTLDGFSHPWLTPISVISGNEPNSPSILMARPLRNVAAVTEII